MQRADKASVEESHLLVPLRRIGGRLMDAAFWEQRWRDGRIGFHQDRVTPLLERYWAATGASQGGRVFVPLAGKSLDMSWLAAQGHRVLGVELSRTAVDQFFAEHRLEPTITRCDDGLHYVAGEIEIVCGDAFALDVQSLEGCNGVYDRAALIALPPDMRRRYADHLYARLPSGCRGLMITLEYPQFEKEGPPFSVPEPEVHALFEPQWSVQALARMDILTTQPAFVAEGVTSLQTVAYRLYKH